ncbi:Alpha/Beta hydrolase protein [Madurella fahalii]|uniref:Alpha/Beta hydrolase protein n=1 Tax=Madurella fahalii TaxID=1157608 RepID=A0ABQ0FX50_9PEZI
MSFIHRIGFSPAQTEGGSSTGFIIAGTVIAAAALFQFLSRALWPTPPKRLYNPLRTVLPRLSQEELDKLEYKPDSFAGARDVDTPYGSIRVYEWGPLTGDKVLFVHGITTSCMTLTKLANALVSEKGCRVMLFDLFGRGFSDNPSDLPHDARLYTTQILLALASAEETSWMDPKNPFKLVGYSLGGGIAVHFATSFPHLVSSLVLLAPAGLIRPESFGIVMRAVFTSGLVPPRLLSWITKKRLQKPIRATSRRGANGNSSGADPAATNTYADTKPKPDPVSASLTEVVDSDSLLSGDGNDEWDGDFGESRRALEERVLRHVHWQLSNHDGFVAAFMSSIRDAPLIGQEEAWRKLARREPGTTAVILARDDEIIDPDEYAADALPLVGGPDRVRWSLVPGGHDFPMTYARETLREMYAAWGM